MTKAASDRLKQAALSIAVEARKARIGWGIPYGDPRHDARIRALTGFSELEQAFRSSPRLRALYGDELARIALSWSYGAAAPGDVGDLWRTYWTSLIEPAWRYVSIANLTNFASAKEEIAIDDSVFIQPRRMAELSAMLGWSPETLEQTLGDDWLRSSGNSEFVIAARSEVPKSPENIVLSSPGTGEPMLATAVMALRLAGAGDVGLGSVFTVRVGGPPVLLLGISSNPASGWLRGGEEYELDDDRINTARSLFDKLKRFEAASERYPELASALDRFRAAYDRAAWAATDRVVDDIIALEAIAVVSDELSYRIAIRVSGLLADSEADRLALFRLVRSFYGVRSTIVHGGRLKSPAQALLQREPELREIVRLTIRALLNLTETAATDPVRSFLEETVDDYVLDAGRRVGLRVATGVPGWAAAATTAPATKIRTTSQWL